MCRSTVQLVTSPGQRRGGLGGNGGLGQASAGMQRPVAGWRWFWIGLANSHAIGHASPGGVRTLRLRNRAGVNNAPRSISATRTPTLRMTTMPTLEFAAPPPPSKSSNMHRGVMGA